MNLEGKTRSDWRAEITQTLTLHLLYPDDEILRDNYNALAGMYKAFFGHWYRPEIKLNGHHYI